MAKNPEGTERSRENAAKWLRDKAQEHAQKTGQDPAKLDREVGDTLRDSDARKRDKGSR